MLKRMGIVKRMGTIFDLYCTAWRHVADNSKHIHVRRNTGQVTAGASSVVAQQQQRFISYM